jgi:hypothetical protein
MSFIRDGNRLRGRDNVAQGSPAGVENIQPGVPPPARFREGQYLAATNTVSGNLSRTNDVVTATFAGAHGLNVGDKINVSGLDQFQYNGDKNVDTVADTTHITFSAFGSPTSPSSGTAVIKKIFQGGGIGD